LEEGNLQQRRGMETEFWILDKQCNLGFLSSSSSLQSVLLACSSNCTHHRKEAAEACQYLKFSSSGFFPSFLLAR
jgi:hypothetical protein